MERDPAVYLMASGFNGTIYTGVTSNLLQRIYQHRTGTFGGFTAEHDVKRLVWFEMHGSMEAAIMREKQIKNWQRAWKVALIVEATRPGAIWPRTSGLSRWSGRRWAPDQVRGDGEWVIILRIRDGARDEDQEEAPRS